jgi:hypothetical protein
MQNQKMSRRTMLGLTASAATAAAGIDWVFAVNGEGKIVKAAGNAEWSPIVLSGKQAERLAAVCEAIIPRTDTPGARDARVHEYIDLSLSIESGPVQTRFLEGLDWLDKYCKKQTRRTLDKVDPADLDAVLEPLSDAHEDHDEDLRPGVSFFSDIKSRTIFGYYTSREGWVEELGRPEFVGMEKFLGCPHSGQH